MIIFGWGNTRTKDYGEAYPIYCENCQNEVFYHTSKIRDWFTLFFIPVIPYRKEYWLSCPVCGAGYEIEGRKKRKKAVEMANKAEKFGEGEITQEEWLESVESFENMWLEIGPEERTEHGSEKNEIESNEKEEIPSDGAMVFYIQFLENLPEYPKGENERKRDWGDPIFAVSELDEHYDTTMIMYYEDEENPSKMDLIEVWCYEPTQRIEDNETYARGVFQKFEERVEMLFDEMKGEFEFEIAAEYGDSVPSLSEVVNNKYEPEASHGEQSVGGGDEDGDSPRYIR